MSRRNLSSEMKAAVLRTIRDHEIRSASELGFRLIEVGAVTVKHRRGRLTSRGAGFVGGALLSMLQREGLVSVLRTDYSREPYLTGAGKKFLESAPSHVSDLSSSPGSDKISP